MLLIFTMQFSVQLHAAKEIIKSKDDIVFHTPDTLKFSDIGKISEFRGVIDRVNFTAQDLKMIDLYQFNTDLLKVDNSLCLEFIEKIFAVSVSNVFQVKTFKIIDSNKGKVCEVLVTNKTKSKKKEETYFGFVSIGFVNAKANVLVYHLKGINDDKITEARLFWNSLR